MLGIQQQINILVKLPCLRNDRIQISQLSNYRKWRFGLLEATYVFRLQTAILIEKKAAHAQYSKSEEETDVARCFFF